MISVKHAGDFNNLEDLLNNAGKVDYLSILNSYGRLGVMALSNATPVDTGETAGSWEYSVTVKNGSARIDWYNTHTIKDGTPVAILLQYGHGTGSGGYVVGRDYINPALRPIFDSIAGKVWKEVANA